MPDQERMMWLYCVIIAAMLPVLIDFPFFRKHLEAGVISGAMDNQPALFSALNREVQGFLRTEKNGLHTWQDEKGVITQDLFDFLLAAPQG